MGFFSKGLKNEFEIAVVNEPSVFESLKFYCTYTKQKYVETSTPEKKGNREILQIFSIFLNTKKICCDLSSRGRTYVTTTC